MVAIKRQRAADLSSNFINGSFMGDAGGLIIAYSFSKKEHPLYLF
jgi:hypothetical protein